MLPGVTLVLVGRLILTPSSNPALHRANLEVVGRPTQDGRRVLFLMEQEISGSKNNMLIRWYCTGSNMYLQVERKSGVRLECSIEMNKGNYLYL